MTESNVAKKESSQLVINQEAATKENHTPDEENDLPPEIEQIIEQLPPDEKKQIVRMMMMSRTSIQGPVNMTSQLANKIEKEHITKLLEISEKSDERQFIDRQRSKLYVLLFFILGAAIFIFITVYLAKDKSDIYIDILKVIFAFIGGLGFGKFLNTK